MLDPARLLLLIGLLCFSGCATLAPRPEQKLVGRWRYENQQQQAEYTFARDGTFTGTVIVGGSTVADFHGRWSLSDGAILYEYLGDKKGSIPAGTRDRDRLVSATRDSFVIEARDGSKRTYQRVRD